MENASVVVTEMGVSSEEEIAARLERATRSVLGSSSLASYSYSQSPAREGLSSQIPSLADLLTHVGPPDCPRCPSCRAPLPFGPRSRLCLACDATFIEISPPSITSSVAFRCFSEALGLETDFGVAEEDHFQDKEADNVVKSSASSSSASGAGGVQKESQHDPLDLKSSTKEVITTNAFSHRSTSCDFSSVPLAETELPIDKQSNILDYSHKLKGFSLEDFFSNQIKQEPPMRSKSDTKSVDISGALTSIGTVGIQVRKDSLFWDPLSDDTIPDGFDLMANTSEPITNQGIASKRMVEVDKDNDPFSFWEGDFQSAPPATSEPSTSHASETQSFVQPGDFDDFFGSSANSKERSDGENVGLQGNNGWANNAHFNVQDSFWDPLSETINPDGFDMMATTSEPIINQGVASERVVEVEEDDDPFSSWEGDFQSAPPATTDPSTSHASEAQSFVQPVEFEDFFGSSANSKERSDGVNVGLQGNNGGPNNTHFNVGKDSLFWDPLSETIMPDGFDMMASTREPITNQGIALEKMVEVEEDDDPFSSWDGDFQSAPLAMTDPSTSHTSEAQSYVKPGEFDDFFGSFANSKERSEGENVGLQGNNGWANNTHIFGSNPDTTVGRSVDDDDFSFGSEWQQNVQPSAILATNGSQSTSFFDGEDIFGPFSSLPKEMPLNDSRFDSLQEGNSTATEDQKNVGSTLAQLHDLSFMLTDKLVIKTEGNNAKPNFSG